MIHLTAVVSQEATVGDGTKVWHHAQIREGVVIGCDCIIGKDVYIDFDVRIGDRCKLQNGVYIYHGVTLGEGVFLGPGVMCLNDRYPRAINPTGALKTEADWHVSFSYIGDGAGIGGGAIILPGVTIGKWAIVGGGAIVTRDVPDHGLVYGNPARLRGFVCKCGQRLDFDRSEDEEVYLICSSCKEVIILSKSIYQQIQPNAEEKI